MFLAHTVMGNLLLERTMFTDLGDAKKWAQDRVQEKVQRIDHMAFMGDVNVVFYELPQRFLATTWINLSWLCKFSFLKKVHL
tara:strand:+ start:454 stop:699 length:246 start_codon:yes stop_codon:yes gene_type:complete